MIENLAGERYIHGTNSEDYLAGGMGDNIIFGRDGDDNIYGLDGNDTLYGMKGNDRIFGDVGNDVIYGGEGEDRLHGYIGDDRLYGDEGNDYLFGGEGNDILYGGEGDDILSGGEGSDTLYGGSGNDILYGDEGDDILDGGAGKDIYVFRQGHGKDTVIDSATSDEPSTLYLYSEPKFFARTDSDLILYTSAQDQITIKDYFTASNYVELKIGGYEWWYGGKEEIIASFSSEEMNTIAQNLPLSTTLYGTEGYDDLSGDAERSNIIYGLGGSDAIYGGNENDLLVGENGSNDKLYGGGGNDLLIAGEGKNMLYGGEGSDTYIFSHPHVKTYSDVVVDSPTGGSPNVLIFEGAEIRDGQHVDHRSFVTELFSRSGDDLFITAAHYAGRYSNDADFGSVKVTGYFKNPEAFKFIFDDRTIENYDQLLDIKSGLAHYETDGITGTSSAVAALEQQNTQAVI